MAQGKTGRCKRGCNWQYMSASREQWDEDVERYLVEPVVLRICKRCGCVEELSNYSGWRRWKTPS